MVETLAQTDTKSLVGIFDVVVNVFSHTDALAHPKSLVDSLSSLHIAWSIIFLVAGLTCLLNGYRYYKIVVVCLAAAIGLFGGYKCGVMLNASGGGPYIIAACLGLLCAITCIPLMKYSVAAMGGLAGAFIGGNIWSAAYRLAEGADVPVQNAWIGALIGLVVFGMLAFITFKLSVVVFTSVAGAMVCVLGAMSLILNIPSWKPSVTESISAHAIVMPLLVFVPAIIGLILQESYKEDGGKPAS